MSKSDAVGNSAIKVGKGTNPAGKVKSKKRKETALAKTEPRRTPKSGKSLSPGKGMMAPGPVADPSVDERIFVRHEQEVPEGLPKKYFLKSTFNTHDIMHAPVEKTLKMLDEILAGERLFTM